MKTPIQTLYDNRSKKLLNIIFTMHPNDIYDFLADNGADPWKPTALSHDYLIDCLVIFCAESTENAYLLLEWFENCKNPIPEN